MAKLTPTQQATRARVEGLIALAAPLLDVVLGFGERISRIAEPTDHEYYPIRSGGEQRLPGEAGADAGGANGAAPSDAGGNSAGS